MKKMIFFILISSFVILSFFASPQLQIEDCIDGVCLIPKKNENEKEIFAISSPIGYHNVKFIKQAPRLSTLNGKTIALVGGSFNAFITHEELKKCILSNYPTAKVLMFEDIGDAGPFSVTSQSKKTISFQKALKDNKVDAIISGNCACGLCTVKECGSSIAAEYIGIPSVTIGSPTFIQQIYSTGVNRGVPVLRAAEYPGAFASDSKEDLIKKTREKVWPQVEELLKKQISKEEIIKYAHSGERPFDEIIFYGTFEEIQDFCEANNWTDGLPIIPPTDQTIREYLKYCVEKADTVIGTFAPAYRKSYGYTVVANAVMSGIPKEFMPICMAFVRCLGDGEFRRTLSSTHGWTPYAWLNGPLARQLGIDCGQGMISEDVNKKLGRFIELAMLNIGGYYIKDNRMGTFGYLTPWTFAEDEQACLNNGWIPYHVEHGFKLNSNTITAGSALAWGNNVSPSTDNAEMIMKTLAFDITEKQQNGLGNTKPQVYRTIFITEPIANNLSKQYKSKSDLEDALIENARRPLWMRTFAYYWANTGSSQDKKRSIEQEYMYLKKNKDEKVEKTETPDWLKGFVNDDKIETIATMLKGQTPILVTGDSSRNKFQVMPGGGYVTFEIKLPKNWNELVKPLGYEPIENFFLK